MIAYRRLLKPKFLLFAPLLALLVVALACGEDATPVVIEKQVPVEIEKEVIVEKEVPVEVVKEVILVATPTPTPTPVARFVTSKPESTDAMRPWRWNKG